MDKFSAAQRRSEESRAIARLLIDQAQVKNATHVCLFAAQSHEVDLSFLWDSLNRKFCYPRVHGKNLDFYEVSSIDELTPGYAGILEPPTSANKITDWTTEDLILVPGRRFDWEGGRTGSGLGFYDRFLDANPAQKWGVAFENQVSKEPLAQKPTDVRMDAIVTHAGIKVLRKR